MSELKVACDLSSRGYEIFTQFGANSCDLVALRGGACLRVEVKSGYFRGIKVGKLQRFDGDKHDVLAIVFPTHIQYIGLPDVGSQFATADSPEWAVEYIGADQ